MKSETALYYNLFFVFRRSLTILIVVYETEFQFFQSTALMVLGTFQLVCLAHENPFDNKLDYCLDIFH